MCNSAIKSNIALARFGQLESTIATVQRTFYSTKNREELNNPAEKKGQKSTEIT
jgi:hypothetical protein